MRYINNQEGLGAKRAVSAIRAVATAAIAVSLALGAALAAPVSALAAQGSDGSSDHVALTQQAVDEANDAYNNNGNAELEFISMSDTHVASYEQKKWAFQNIQDWSKQIGFKTGTVLMDGDVEANEYQKHPDDSDNYYKAVAQLVHETFPGVPVQFASGNHDISSNMIRWFDQLHGDETWYYKAADGDDARYINFHTQINGYDFITLDYHDQSYVPFLKRELAAIKARSDYDAKKPIFIQIHSGLNGTTTGSYQDIAGQQIQTILADWPQAIVGTAHSHYSAEVETGIYQKDFTVYNNGSMDYLEWSGTDSLEGSVSWIQGNLESKRYELTCNYITVQKDGKVIIRRFDVTNKRWMGKPWIVELSKGKAGFQYTPDKRDKVAPWFTEGSKLTVDNIKDTSADLTFDQAVDNQLVEYYRVTVRDFLTNQDATYKVSPENAELDTLTTFPKDWTGTFKAYSRYYIRPYPKQMKFYFSALAPNTRYRVIVQAFDSFDNASTVKDTVFKTSGSTEELPHELAPTLKNGRFLDMDFDKSDLADAAGTVTGATKAGDVTFVDGANGSGKAVHLAAGNDTYIDLGKLSKASVGTDNSLTVNFWLNSESTSGDATVISDKDWASGSNKGWYIGYRESNLSQLGVNAADGSKRLDLGIDGSYEGKWHMVTVTFDRAQQKVFFYIDGKLGSTGDTLGQLGNMTTGLPVRIGTDGAGGNGNAAFSLDDLEMWDRALTADEILSIYGTATYKPDTTDWAAKLKETIGEADKLIAEADEQNPTFVYDAGLVKQLRDEVEKAKKASTKDEQQVWTAQLLYIMGRVRGSMTAKYLDKSAFKAVATSSWYGDRGESTPDHDYAGKRLHSPDKAIDGDDSTGWHTNSTTDANGVPLRKLPQYIVIDLGKTMDITGIDRLGRTPNRDYIKNFKVEAADSLDELGVKNGEGLEVQKPENATNDYHESKPGVSSATGTFADQEDAFVKLSNAVRGRYLKLTVLDTYLMDENGDKSSYVYVRELNFTGHEPTVEHKVTVEAGEGGSVTPDKDVVVANGKGLTLMAVPQDGYRVDAVKVTDAKGAEVEAAFDASTGQITVAKVTSDITVKVTFKKIENGGQQPGGNGGNGGQNGGNGGDNGQQPGGNGGNGGNGGQTGTTNHQGSGKKQPASTSNTPKKRGPLPQTGDYTGSVIAAVVVAGVAIIGVAAWMRRKTR